MKYNPKPKLPGVSMDETLKFDDHIESVERKGLRAKRSLERLRKFMETKILLKYKCMLKLYRTLVTLQLQYAACNSVVD